MAKKRFKTEKWLATLPNTALAYYRVSTTRQEKTGNIEQQKPDVERRCSEKGWEILARFEEAVSGSGETSPFRDKFSEMMEYCRANRGKVGHIVVWDLKRFARDALTFQMFQAELNDLNVQLEILNLPPETTATNRLLRSITAAMAEHGAAIDAEASTRGMLIAMRERGMWPYQAPVGYTTSKIRRASPCMIPDPERAPKIKKLFEEFASGKYSQVEVKQRAKRRGLRSKKGNANFQIRPILDCFAYAGKMRDFETGEILQGNWEPLISWELFEKVQVLLKARTPQNGDTPINGGVRPYRKMRDDFPLKQVVKCAHCGELLTAYWKKNCRYYRCFMCHKIHIRAEILERLFLALLDEVQPSSEYLENLRKRVLDTLQKCKRDKIASRKAIQTSLAENARKRELLTDAFVYRQKIDEATYNAEKDRLDAERRDLLRKQLAAVDAHLLNVDKMLDAAMRNLSDFRHRWEHGSLESKLAIQRIAFPECVKFDGTTIEPPVTSMFCNGLQHKKAGKSGMAPRAGIEPASKP